VGETGRPREQHFSGLHRHGNDEAWDEQPGMVCGLVEVYAYGPRRRAAGGGECGGFSRIRSEQLFHGKQSGRRRRLYMLVSWWLVELACVARQGCAPARPASHVWKTPFADYAPQ